MTFVSVREFRKVGLFWYKVAPFFFKASGTAFDTGSFSSVFLFLIDGVPDVGNTPVLASLRRLSDAHNTTLRQLRAPARFDMESVGL